MSEVVDALETAFLLEWLQTHVQTGSSQLQQWTLPAENHEELSWQRFTSDYLVPNKPVLVRGAGKQWRAAKEYVRKTTLADLERDKEADALIQMLYKRLCEVLGLSGPGSNASRRDNETDSANTPDFRKMLFEAARQYVYQLRDAVPDFVKIQAEFGGATVSVVDCLTREFNSQCRGDMNLSDYLREWKNAQPWYWPPESDTAESHESSSWRYCKYLRDWHATRDFPNCDFYRCPNIFANDWIDEYWAYAEGYVPSVLAKHARESTTGEDRKDQPQINDYRFLYMGPGTSFTPLHRDVFGSYSWSTNFAGAKLWLFYPPTIAERTLQRSNESVNCDAFTAITPKALLSVSANADGDDSGDNSSDPFVMAYSARTNQQKAMRALFRRIWHEMHGVNITNTNGAELGVTVEHAPYLLVQRPGDAVFVPAMWTHEVFNLSPAASLNHNWSNALGLPYLFKQLRVDHEAVQRELAEFGVISGEQGHTHYWTRESWRGVRRMERPRNTNEWLDQLRDELDWRLEDLKTQQSTHPASERAPNLDVIQASERVLLANAGIDHSRFVQMLLFISLSTYWRFVKLRGLTHSHRENVTDDMYGILPEPLQRFGIHLRDVFPRFDADALVHLPPHHPQRSHFHYALEHKDESRSEVIGRLSILALTGLNLSEILPALLLVDSASTNQSIGSWIMHVGSNNPPFHPQENPYVPLPRNADEARNIIRFVLNLTRAIATVFIQMNGAEEGAVPENTTRTQLDIAQAGTEAEAREILLAWMNKRRYSAYGELIVDE